MLELVIRYRDPGQIISHQFALLKDKYRISYIYPKCLGTSTPYHTCPRGQFILAQTRTGILDRP